VKVASHINFTPAHRLPPGFDAFRLRVWAFGLRLLVVGSLGCALSARAQTPPHLPPGGLMQLQVPQGIVDVSSPVSAAAVFDPPVAHVGDRVFYRVTVDATESSVTWPDAFPTPAELGFGAQASGQIMQTQGARYRPLASFVYEVKPRAEGRFTVTNFTVEVSGARVAVPSASLDVAPKSTATVAARRLRLDIPQTKVFVGQSFPVRVILPTGPDNELEALREIELHGDGLMVDRTASHQSIEPVNLDGQLRMAFTAELNVVALAAGPLKFTAQGFTAGREFMAPISIRGQVRFPSGPTKYILLVSEAAELSVRPLPEEGQPASFTGAIGRFFNDPPRLSTNRVQVGEPLQLKVTFHGEGDFCRFVPPAAPLSRDWQIIADPPPATSFTLVPLADDLRATPAIPFSYFDPDLGKYEDLTIAPQPVTVLGQGLPLAVAAAEEPGKTVAPLKLSALAQAPGGALAGLRPLQLRGWFAGLQLVPLAGFIALWQWDRRRRFLAAHPDLVRRARARRELRRARRQLQAALDAGDAAAFVQCAARAMAIAAAPHFPAEATALVGGDVLAQLDAAGQDGPYAETVRQVFAAADAAFAVAPQVQTDWLTWRPGVEAVLEKLEERL